MRLLDRELGPRLLLKARDEASVDVAPQLASRIVRDVQELGRGVRRQRDRQDGEDRQEGDEGVPNQRRRAVQELEAEGVRPPRGDKDPSAEMG